MAEAYIVAASRTAGGRKGGRLRDWHPSDLAGKVLDDLVARCLDKDPMARPGAVGDIAAALASLPLPPWTRERARDWWERWRDARDAAARPRAS